MNVLIMGGSTDIGISLAKYLTSKDYKVIIGYYHHKKEIPNIEFIEFNIMYNIH